ncbi:chemotaxis-specific protein-glutamate methyltransferase CheB [bacterium]|nr:chemotaxis-specific protein-glutamate methyltransferase CheB [bacterium]
MIRLMVAEDSAVVRANLVHILESDPELTVVAQARNGLEAVSLARTKRPDVITMDIHMPELDGFQATREIMASSPVPIVIVTASWDQEQLSKTFQAIEAGAVNIAGKPPAVGHPKYDHSARELIQLVKAMSEVKVVRRIRSLTPAAPSGSGMKASGPGPGRRDIRLVAIGASTGGPPVLQTILSGLPRNFPAPVLVVQHITVGFIQGLIDWLDSSSSVQVRLAQDGEVLMPGRAYFAPDNYQMGLLDPNRISLVDDPPENHLRPSVSYLFRSVARVCGKQAAAVLLTGMGCDGAAEMNLIRESGGLTIAQDRESSMIFGMPGEAQKLGAAGLVLPPGQIVDALLGSVQSEAPRDAVDKAWSETGEET